MAAASSMSGWASDASNASDKEESNKPYAGYRRTNSFDRSVRDFDRSSIQSKISHSLMCRFPFMSRPLSSGHRPCSTVPSKAGVQSLTNPNVLFCTPQDIRRATLARY